MEKNRLEAFTDGVIAVIITIMVLELKPPHAATWQSLLGNWPVFLSYVLSFVYVGIYWNNHHHLMQLVERIDGKVMWANLHFLFWLSLFPFATAWLNEAHGEHSQFPAPLPTAIYGIVLLMTALSWIPLARFLVHCNGGPGCALARALASGWKEIISPILYLIAIVLANFAPIVSCVLYAAVAAIWFVPDRRIENHVMANK
ncbi:TMEM175 family protein [Rudaea sp.]|uniref:TMEM175 family protein n=1 Tax=Rudaea sp. TaxID=2136325 RepID=UPI00321F9A3D